MTSLLASPSTRRLTHTTPLPYSSNITFSALADLSSYQNVSSLIHTSTVTSKDPQHLPRRATFNIGYPPLGLTEEWQCSVKSDRKSGTIEIKRDGSSSIFEKNIMRWKVSPAGGGKTSLRLDLELKFKSYVVDGMFSMMESWVAEACVERFAALVKARDETEKKERKQRGAAAAASTAKSPPPAKKRTPRKLDVASAPGKQKATV